MKTDRHDIIEILLKMALKHHKPNPKLNLLNFIPLFSKHIIYLSLKVLFNVLVLTE
jgi:hypothetical protein